MFKFGFTSENTENDSDDTNEENYIQWLESIEVKPEVVNNNKNLDVNTINCGDFIIKHVSNEAVVNTLKNDKTNEPNPLLNAERNHSDLITAVYEGGLKVWECTYDLLNFISESGINFSNKNVLDLGCGAGIVGILSCLKGAKTCFQDYNIEVIKSVTMQNVHLNNIELEQCSFYCGDWKSFSDLLKEKLLNNNDKFDYIFTSETIYNIGNYKKLLEVFRNLLKEDGVIYLAAKYYYFGVGGGIGQFEDMLKKDNIFNYTTAWICSEGIKRAIIKITFKYLRC